MDARVRPPGSRSGTNRALLAAGLADGTSELRGVAVSDDIEAMRDGLRTLGVEIEEPGATWRVHGRGGRLAAPTATVDVRASGTTARFLTAAAALAEGPVLLDGTERMRERPIDDLADALRTLGADVEVLGRGGCPPVRVAGGGLPGGTTRVDARRSSQFVSGLLLAAPCAAADVRLELEDGVCVSRPFVDMTLRTLDAFGADARWDGDAALVVKGGTGYRAAAHDIEADAQSAVYAFGAAAIAGGRVVVDGLPAHSAQADLGLLEALASMGCRVARGPDAVTLEAPPVLRGIQVDANRWPDAALALAVVALFAEGETEIRGLGHLRFKESDRLHVLAREITRLGGDARAENDTLRIRPRPLTGAAIETYDDHRVAMSFALAGLRVPGVSIRDPGCVAKTWPRFFEEFARW